MSPSQYLASPMPLLSGMKATQGIPSDLTIHLHSRPATSLADLGFLSAQVLPEIPLSVLRAMLSME